MAGLTIKKYDVLPTLVPFHESNAPARLIVGPFGSGKSVAAVVELWLNSRLSHNTRYLIIRKTYRMLMDSCVKTFFEWVPKEIGNWSEANMTFTCVSPSGGTAEFLFRSADSADDIEKFRGVEITGAWLDEAQELTSDVKLIVQGRLRFPLSHPFYTVILTTNPCDTEHWIYKSFVMDPLPGHVYWRQSSRENTFLPESYYKDIEAAYRDRPELKKRYVDGQWGAVFDGKPVYGNEFNWEFHVSKQHLKPVLNIPIHRGWDFGLTPACVITQVHPNGTWMILRELYSDEMGIDEFGDAVNDFCKREYKEFLFEDIGDPAGKTRAQTDERSCYDILASKMIYCREAETNALIPRLESVKRQLLKMYRGSPRICIDPRCKRLIDGFSGGYKYKERGNAGTHADTPDKNKYSHIHDALQYAAMTLFGYAEHNPKIWQQEMPRAATGIF
jgi:PBSX family phage terminase large subunit